MFFNMHKLWLWKFQEYNYTGDCIMTLGIHTPMIVRYYDLHSDPMPSSLKFVLANSKDYDTIIIIGIVL